MRFPLPIHRLWPRSSLQVFTRIYRENEWLAGSGEGSLPENTEEYRALLQRFLCEKQIQSVVDVGCGDWQFSRLIDWSGINYTGIDVVPALVEHNQERFSNDHIRFLCADALRKPLPVADLLIVKDVLQHWPNRAIKRFLLHLPQYQYALFTNCIHGQNNRNVPFGSYRGLALCEAPFHVPAREVLRYRWRASAEERSGWKQVVLWERSQGP